MSAAGEWSLLTFLRLGFQPQSLYGIDIHQERIDKAKAKYPLFNLVQDNADSMPDESDTFNLVFESTMFVQLTDAALSRKIANEMFRVTEPIGYILIVDWRNSTYSGVSKARIKELFNVDVSSKILCQKKGAIVPSIGRCISKRIPAIYFLLSCPFLWDKKQL